MNSNISISICMPVYNASRYLRDCIDSILSQSFTDFELLIVDDGSTDDSVEIIRSYSDSRIRLIENKHDYIGSLNLLLQEARGKYIARMDADDVMLPNRLETQYQFMETHAEIDVLGGQMNMFNDEAAKDTSWKSQVKEGTITLSDMISCCCVCHPTTMLRKDCLSQFAYRPDAKYAEDYALWVELLSAEKRIFNLSAPLIYYRVHKTQISQIHNNEQQLNTLAIKQIAIANLFSLTEKAFGRHEEIPASLKKLTVVIPFLNEREEVRNTVKSVRDTAGDKVEIIVINDDSDKDYDYESELECYGVTYIRNSYRIGAALSKERGAQLSRTPYFLLLDAHMRFYFKDWAEYLIQELESDSERLLCSTSIALEKKEDGSVIISPNNTQANGAYLTFKDDYYIPGVQWNYYRGALPTDAPNQIPCVLGAGYATSKTYWNKIKGLQGLIHSGCEEAYISIKSWMQGGGCYLLPKLEIGHIYRKKFPYKLHSFEYAYNYLLISETLFPLKDKCIARALAWKVDKHSFENAMLLLQQRKQYNHQLEQFYKTHFIKKNYAYVKRLNEICEKIANSKDRICEDLIPKVLEYIVESIDPNMGIGLYNGLAGVLATALLCEKNEPGTAENLAIESWEHISAHIKDEFNIDFQSGLSGIGWLLIYASYHQLLEDDIEEELKIIDYRIIQSSIKRNRDLTFPTGVGGVYCYVVLRLLFQRKFKIQSAFPDDFMDELINEADRILASTNDWRTMNYVWQFKVIERIDAITYSPSFYEVVDLPDYIPSNKVHWKISLKGVLGSIINKLIN